jgi:hypothetical protein
MGGGAVCRRSASGFSWAAHRGANRPSFIVPGGSHKFPNDACDMLRRWNLATYAARAERKRAHPARVVTFLSWPTPHNALFSFLVFDTVATVL